MYKKPDIIRPWQDSNLQSLAPEASALSIRPQGPLKGVKNVIYPNAFCHKRTVQMTDLQRQQTEN